MSSKTRTRKPRTTTTTSPTGSNRPLRTVPDQATVAKLRTDTEDKLWQALHTHPNSAAADLASAAKIGKSTAQKILATWHKDGSVTRTAGIAEGGRRAPDRWAITDGDTDPSDNIPAGDADPADTAQANPTALVDPDTTDAEPADGDPAESTDTGETNPAKAEPVVAEETKPAADSAATDSDTTAEGSGDEKAARLAPGALRGMVEDYVRDHPGEEFGPTAIANALGGKSSGAVSNALDKLVEDKTVVKTKESPRRFALAPTEQATAPVPTK